ncbi:MAG: glycosyltransferase family 2 protein [Chlamydiae bacterium]|nr:glycosyltransferase family 2 protein [Chlamydiota bacterium]MBI3277331.1 glycosyltransferase family 2 protein [Chlamydiota bacterium]
MESDQLQVSIVVVNWNGKSLLEKCLSSLFEGDDQNFEIIFVDNGSVDGSVDFVAGRFPQIKIVRNQSNLGFAIANNIGAQNASGAFLLFLNNDTIVEKDFLSKLIEGIKDEEEVAACQPKIKVLGRPTYLDSAGSFPTLTGFLRHDGIREVDVGQYDQVKEIFSPKGACLLIRKDIFQAVGGFDEDFFCYFEETDLAWRIWLYGYRILLIPQAVIYHKGGATSEKLDFSFVQYHSNKNRINSYLKNLSIANLLWLLPLHLTLYFFLMVYSALFFKFDRVSVLIKALLWNFFGFSATLKKRRFVQTQVRRRSDGEVFKGKMASIPWKEYGKGALYFLNPKFFRES